MIEVNYLLVIGLALLSMVIGAVWYGPLFGARWMELNGVDPSDKEAIKKMQKGMMQTYVLQFVLILLEVWVLYHYVIGAIDEMGALSNVLWIWAGFIVPTLAAASMWTTEAPKDKRARFLIQAGYNLVLFLVLGYAIGAWG